MSTPSSFITPARRHVVLGAGPLGRATAAALAKAGHAVRLVNRSGKLSDPPAGVELVGADLRATETFGPIVDGAAAVYFCAQPAYHRWPQEFPALQEAAIAIASKAGARLVAAENLYGYGPANRPFTEDMPMAATTRKGRVRAAMYARLMQARAEGLISVSIARGSDLFGPHVEGSAVGARAFRALLKGEGVGLLGDPNALHTVTFVEDFGAALAVLGVDPRADGQVWHVPNAPAVSQRRFFEIAARLAERRLSVRKVGPLELHALGLFISPVREMIEMQYEFERPFVVDHTKFVNAFGDLSTPLEAALDKTLVWIRGKAPAPVHGQ